MGGLDFCHLQDFNKAMLAKQGWRLLTKPESLCARVLKHRYYRNTDFLHVTKGHNSSFSWQSIIEGHIVLRYGVQWRIGNGEWVNAWLDPWIPGDLNLRPYGPMPEGGENVRVVDLIDWSAGCWCREVLQNHFIQADIERICSIILSLLAEEDKIMWQYEFFGDYIVKSGYLLLQNIHGEEVNSTDKRVWTIVCSSQILKKNEKFYLASIQEMSTIQNRVSEETYC